MSVDSAGGADSRTTDNSPVDRAQRLFLYLRELANLRSKTVRDLNDYEQAIWLADFPDGTPAATAFDVHDDDERLISWLEVDRVRLPELPDPPVELLPWLDRPGIRRYELDEPPLVEPVEGTVMPEDILDRYVEYVDQMWEPWASATRERMPAYKFYESLFRMSERRQRLGEVYELLVGLGLVAWQRNNQRVCRHLVTTPAEISIDPDTGRITVAPSTSEGRNRFELDMLEPDDQGDLDSVQDIRAEVEATDPLALLESIDALLNEWVNRAHPSGRYLETLQRLDPSDQLRVAAAPAIILRRRGQRTTSELLDAIADRIGQADVELPEGVERLVMSSEPEYNGDGALQFGDPELYFPLPSNEEQRQVVDRIKSQRGVLVQGPPGTGKSLTIANLISHLLAQGKRVLVTSHTERALRVLHEKLPDEIKPLCISLLGNDRDAIRDLEGAVEEISARQADWSPLDVERRVESCRSELGDVRGELAQAQNRLRQIRESDTKPIVVGEYRGTSQAVARELATQSDRLGWIPDEVTTSVPPLRSEEFDELLRLAWELPDDAPAAAEALLPDPALLVAPGRFEELVRAEAETVAGFEHSRGQFGSLVEDLERLDTGGLDVAESALRSIVETARPLLASQGWSADAVVDVLGGHPGPWQARQQASDQYLSTAEELLSTVAEHDVTEMGKHSVKEGIAAAEALIDHAASGGRLKLGLFSAKAVRAHRWLLEDVRLDGSAPRTVEELKSLRGRLELAQSVEDLTELWNHLIDDSDEPVSLRVARFADASADLHRVLSLVEYKSTASVALSESPDAVPQDWTDVETIADLAEAAGSVLRYRQVESIRVEIASARVVLGDDPHPSLEKVREAIDARDPSAYRNAVAELNRIIAMAADFRRLDELRDRLSAMAPSLVGMLPSQESEEWRQRFSTFESAWAWREAQTRLSELVDPGATQRLNRKIGQLNEKERHLLAEMAASLAWIRMFEVLKTEESQALAAWAVAIKQVGKGKGKYAERHRRTARKYMGQARSAIPAWIMPMYRVAENVDALPELFDVVIVDEASQSSVESLFLFYLGRQVVVVGDDQQIAPEAVGIDQTIVHRLQDQYLDGLPFSELFSPESSLFDQANVRFPGRIVLREHFRCMPEIIQFSNEISYRQKSLIPLRQYGSDRLEPIRTVYLEHGYREGRRSAINRPEAEEIVARIEKICADPRYDDKTIGVISLQGSHQSHLVEQMLFDRIGPQEMLARQIVCGDAYAFQGDERDIILLSMVAAPNTRIGALAKETDKRRFNVAASRAKDQVWLIHSVTPEDLSASDMRRRLLEYYLDPKVSQLEEIGEIDPDVLNAPFESRFEQDVYSMIRQKDFRVIPQVPVAGYRIDLVVEGMQGRIAVECDGDKWHGPDRWEADMARQRQLERAGWVFFRVSGSDFYADPDAALEPLWILLDRHGIHPRADGSATSVSTRVDPLTGPDQSLALSDDEHVDCHSEAAVDMEGPHVPTTSGGLPGGAERAVSSIPSDQGSDSALDEPAGDHPLGLRVDDRLQHPWKGAATVVKLRFPASAGETVVEIRFDEGGEFEYSEDEYRQAGFVRAGPDGEDADDGAPRTGPSDRVAPLPYDIPMREQALTSRSRIVRHGSLPTHAAWTPTDMPDPRDTDTAVMARYMKSVVEAEGPVTADRIYKLVIMAAGFSRVTKPVRGRLNRALFAMDGVDLRELRNPQTNWPQRVARLHGTPEVAVRELGERDFYEVPLDEIAALMEDLTGGRPRRSIEVTKRRVLDAYGGRKLTKKADQYLEAALELLGDESPRV